MRRKLQCSTPDIVERYILIYIIKCFVKLRRDDEKKSDTVFEKDMTMAVLADIDGIMASRRCGRQTQRCNIPADYAKVYFRRAVFLPFLDSMIQQCNIRFGEHALSFIKASIGFDSKQHSSNIRLYYPKTLLDRCFDSGTSYYETRPTNRQQ